MKISNLVLCGTLLLLAITCHFVSAFEKCTGQPNTKPFVIAEDNMTLMKQVKNGKLYKVNKQSADTYMYVLHVWGEPKEMGIAHGQLFKEELGNLLKTYMDYLDKFIGKYIPYLPEYWKELVAKYGLNAALDLTWEATRLYTPQRFIDEIQGISEGSGIPEAQVRRLNMLPELIKAGCSMAGVWGEATSKTKNGTLLQLRALDWDDKAPISEYPTLVVYHPNEGNTFVNVAYPSFVGTITGVSETMLGISEKVWLGHDDGFDSRIGKPWNYVLRDIMQYTYDLDSAISSLANTHRTCSIHIGVGDSVTNRFAGIEYSYKELNIYDWSTQPEYQEHPRMKDVVYWDKHVQPSHHPCLGSLMKDYYANYTAEAFMQYIAPIHETGNAQLAVYDFDAKRMYVAYSKPPNTDGPTEAYKRQAIAFDLTRLFAEKQ
mmetsp:Transcript_6283/g.9131  ORF Transcript_6283/g.9131 Transcript_6283/m.9131 type:complete len:431 (+) Transcript_6283:29-1321(+)